MPTEPERPGLPYTVLKDDREKAGKGWDFKGLKSCEGTQKKRLKTGDYTLVGYEDLVCVERKGTVDEFAGNVYQSRFEKELVRMRDFPVAIVVLEFSLEDVVEWPTSSKRPVRRLPKHLQHRGGVLARFWELKIKHPHINFIIAGPYGEDAVVSLFKRVVEKYGPGRRKTGAA